MLPQRRDSVTMHAHITSSHIQSKKLSLRVFRRHVWTKDPNKTQNVHKPTSERFYCTKSAQNSSYTFNSNLVVLTRTCQRAIGSCAARQAGRAA